MCVNGEMSKPNQKTSGARMELLTSAEQGRHDWLANVSLGRMVCKGGNSIVHRRPHVSVFYTAECRVYVLVLDRIVAGYGDPEWAACECSMSSVVVTKVPLGGLWKWV